MSEFKETVTTSQDEGIDESGVNVQQQTRKIKSNTKTDAKLTASNLIWYIVGFIEIILAFRFVLKLFGANSNSSFVDLIYSITGFLTAPFDSIFGVSKSVSGNTQSVFEPSILVAGAVYSLVGWGIVKFINVNRSEN